MWRPEPIYVEKYSDEVWIGVKGQSNWEIAGSPRNIFRYSLVRFDVVVKHRIVGGVIAIYPAIANSEYRKVIHGRQTVGANVHRQEGNNPDHQLRSPSVY